MYSAEEEQRLEAKTSRKRGNEGKRRKGTRGIEIEGEDKERKCAR